MLFRCQNPEKNLSGRRGRKGKEIEPEFMLIWQVGFSTQIN